MPEYPVAQLPPQDPSDYPYIKIGVSASVDGARELQNSALSSPVPSGLGQPLGGPGGYPWGVPAPGEHVPFAPAVPVHPSGFLWDNPVLILERRRSTNRGVAISCGIIELITVIIALIINKYKTVSYGKVLMLCDLIIIGCSLFIFKNITSVIYGYVMVAVFGYTIDAVMAGNRQSAQILIVSPKYDQIAERIFSEMHRGVTLLDGEGWYTKTPTKVVMVVCRKNETGILFRVIKEVDPHAFMTFGSVMGVYGLGFEALKK